MQSFKYKPHTSAAHTHLFWENHDMTRIKQCTCSSGILLLCCMVVVNCNRLSSNCYQETPRRHNRAVKITLGRQLRRSNTGSQFGYSTSHKLHGGRCNRLSSNCYKKSEKTACCTTVKALSYRMQHNNSYYTYTAWCASYRGFPKTNVCARRMCVACIWKTAWAWLVMTNIDVLHLLSPTQAIHWTESYHAMMTLLSKVYTTANYMIINSNCAHNASLCNFLVWNVCVYMCMHVLRASV